MPARMSLLRLVVLTIVLLVRPASAADPVPAGGEWPTYGGTLQNARYSPLDQINRDTVKRLKIAWRWRSPDEDVLRNNPAIHPFQNEGSPVMVGGVLYVSTALSQVAAIDAATGKTLWVHDPKIHQYGTPANLGFLHRGVAYWSDGSRARIFIGTGNGFLIALDARTGVPDFAFGTEGRVDLTLGLRRQVDRQYYTVTSPPVVVGDVVLVGSSIHDYPARKDMPPGDVRAFDVRTGKERWSFHTVPDEGEPGRETWEADSWKVTGSANVWTIMSVDEELGYVYLPTSTPSNDFYGGHRLGHNLYAESLVCVDARTGARVWHFQMIHHGLWDYDLPAAPNLVDITIGGQKVKAVAQVSKQGFTYVFDRVTGTPIWPIEEREVPVSTVPGEQASPTQPFPTRPPPFERQGATEDNLIDFAPELRQEALTILNQYDHGPLFTPPTERGTMSLPSVRGGASWSGAAFDPETATLYVTSVTAPFVLKLRQPSSPEPVTDRYVGTFLLVRGPQGLPLFKPPYGRVTAIDLNRGEHIWTIPLGNGPREHPALKPLNLPPLGWDRRGFPVVTRALLFVAQEGYLSGVQRARDRVDSRIFFGAVHEPKLLVFDKATGQSVGEVDLPANAAGALLTYMAAGKQYIVVPVGGAGVPAELIALTLDDMP
jgi:quinoprotein glucose dehydrogenase